MLERELQRAVIDVAHIFGWRVAHFRPSQTTKGWRTAVEADGKGFPDLVLLRGEQMLVRELKAGRGKPTQDQVEWMQAFQLAGIDVGVWTEDDLSTRVVDELRRR